VLHRFWGPTIPARFETHLPLQEAVARLHAMTTLHPSSLWIPWTDACTMGTVTASKVRLWKYNPQVPRNSFKPIFVGAFQEQPDGRVVLAGRFAVHGFTKVIVAIGIAYLVAFTTFLTVFVGAALVRQPTFAQRSPGFIALQVIGAMFLVAVVALVRLGLRLSRDDVAYLSAAIREALGITDDRPPGFSAS
jgi:hypothetical protein